MTAQSTSGPLGGNLRAGNGVPGGDLGQEGDYYLDNQNPGSVYGPKTSGSWGNAGVFSANATPSSVLYPPALKLPKWAQPSAVLTEFQAGHGFTASGGTFTANDTTDFVRGTQAAKFVSPGDGVTYSITGTVTTADSSAKMPRVTAKVDDITTLASFVIQIATDTSFTNGWQWVMQTGASGSNYYTSGDWVTQTLSYHDATQLGTGPKTGLSAVRFRIRDTGAPVSVHLQMAELIADGSATWPGVVSIVFDDNFQDAIDNGKPRMDLYGYPATTFIIADRMGLSGRYPLAEMKTLQDNNGWELACHAYADAVHGATFTGVTAAQLDADAKAMKAFAVVNGFREADLIAYPKGQYGLTTDGQSTTAILRKYFTAAFTTVNKTKETYVPGDPFRLRRISSISSFSGGYAPSQITGAGGDLDLCKANSSWLILTFHEVVTGTPTATTQITQSDFNSIMDAINAKGIPVVPVGEVLKFASVTTTASATIDTTDIPKKLGSPASPGSGPLAAPWDHVHPRTYWAPEDHGFLSWTQDPATCAGGSLVPTAGTVQFARLHVPVATTITNLVMFVSTAGSGLTAGQNFAGLYNASGTLLSSTADQSAAWASTGTKVMALGAAQAVAAGDYIVGFFSNGTTLPTFTRGLGQSAINAGLTAGSSRYGTAATGQTTSMPASLGALTGAATAWWVALS